jgi:4'-phosphopantetheinyl transferase
VGVAAWSPAPIPRHLEAGEVHVWFAALDRHARSLAGLAGSLSPPEWARAERFRVEHARSEYVRARALVRAILGSYLGIPAKSVVFTEGPLGKPELAHPGGWSFNLSHSHGAALVAVTRVADVGVDVEQVRPHQYHRELAERFFAPSESAKVLALPPGASEEAFFHAWTRKEAFLKAMGLGLSFGSERVEVTLLPHEPVRVLGIDGDPAPAASWSLEALAPAPGYIGAVALQSRSYRLRCWSWPG